MPQTRMLAGFWHSCYGPIRPQKTFCEWSIRKKNENEDFLLFFLFEKMKYFMLCILLHICGKQSIKGGGTCEILVPPPPTSLKTPFHTSKNCRMGDQHCMMSSGLINDCQCDLSCVNESLRIYRLRWYV